MIKRIISRVGISMVLSLCLDVAEASEIKPPDPALQVVESRTMSREADFIIIHGRHLKNNLNRDADMTAYIRWSEHFLNFHNNPMCVFPISWNGEGITYICICH